MTSTVASAPGRGADEPRRGARVQPEAVADDDPQLLDVGAPSARLGPARRPRRPERRPRSSPSCSAFARSAPRASAATSSRLEPTRAAAAAATAPSTIGAAASTTRTSSPAISTAISALISALPRSISTSTPSGEARARIASMTTIASVPIAPGGSAMPPAASIATSSPPISRASSTTPSASFALCETMTSPTLIASAPAGVARGDGRAMRAVTAGRTRGAGSRSGAPT